MKRNFTFLLGFLLVLISLAGNTAIAQTGPVGPNSGPRAACDLCRSEGIHLQQDHVGGCEYLLTIKKGPLCQVTGINWDFGDGQTDYGGNNPSMLHTYAPGSYWVTAQIIVGTFPDTCHIWRYSQINATGCVPQNCGPCQILDHGDLYVTEIPSAGPCFRRFDVINWTASPSCPNVSFKINFGDGTSVTTTNPSNLPHTFPGNGTYTVCVTETRSSGPYLCSTTYCTGVIISNCGVCAPCPITNPANLVVFTHPFNPCRVAASVSPFNGCGDIDYMIDFGDGTSAPYVGLGVQHVYTSSGSFTITLTETHFNGTQTCVSTRTRIVNMPEKCNAVPAKTADVDFAEFEIPGEFMVAPNVTAAGEKITLTWNENIVADHIRMMDSQGKFILQVSVKDQPSAQLQIPQSLPAGMYFLVLNDGLAGISKLIVQ